MVSCHASLIKRKSASKDIAIVQKNFIVRNNIRTDNYLFNHQIYKKFKKDHRLTGKNQNVYFFIEEG